jgi:hypothetical protein
MKTLRASNKDRTLAIRIAAAVLELRDAGHKAMLARDVWLVRRARAMKRGEDPNRAERVQQAELELREAEERRDLLAAKVRELRGLHG